jgi:hypothetical protein
MVNIGWKLQMLVGHMGKDILFVQGNGGTRLALANITLKLYITP